MRPVEGGVMLIVVLITVQKLIKLERLMEIVSVKWGAIIGSV